MASGLKINEDEAAQVRTIFELYLEVGSIVATLKELDRRGWRNKLSITPKKGNKRCRYYVCTGAQKRGWHTCPSKSIPAKQIENFVIQQIKKVGHAPDLIQDVVTSVEAKMKDQLKQLEDERLALGRDTPPKN